MIVSAVLNVWLFLLFVGTVVSDQQVVPNKIDTVDISTKTEETNLEFEETIRFLRYQDYFHIGTTIVNGCVVVNGVTRCNYEITANSLRLVNGATTREGRVEVYHDGEWGTVCHRLFDDRDAEVICRQLGFKSGASARTSSFFGSGVGPIWLNELECLGTESTVTSCPHRGWGDDYLCDHAYDAGVICNGAELLTTRLVDGSTDREGRIEIVYQGSWSTVCQTGMTSETANVVCRQLGFSGGQLRNAAHFTEGTGNVYLTQVHCKGNERSLNECPHYGWDDPNQCQHKYDAGVICDVPLNYKGAAVPIRLQNGATDREGRVEVFYKEQWGSVCLHSFGNNGANTVCRQLGFSGGKVRDYDFYQPSATGKIWLSDVKCTGTELGLNECPHDGWGETLICSHDYDVGVICDVDPTFEGISTVPVRLMDGSTDYEGRVEVLYNGVWGTVCHDDFDDEDATVVCRQLGYNAEGKAHRYAYFQQGTGTIWLANVHCTGEEFGLNECRHSPWDDISGCDHNDDVGVACNVENIYNNTYDDTLAPIRLVDGSSHRDGRVEILYQGEWGSVCDDDFDNLDAEVVCRQLGFTGGITRFGAFFQEAAGKPLWLDYLRCTGKERGIGKCLHNGWGKIRSCSHAEDVGVICEDEIHSLAPVRLVDGSTHREGRVEVLYQDEWGSVCDDDFTDDDAQVVCRQLGFGGGVARYAAFFQKGLGSIMLDYVRCTGLEQGLGDCLHYGWKNVRTCTHAEDVSVVCNGINTENATVPIRLVNNDGASDYGRVEVLYNDIWGSVCDDNFVSIGALIICKQLGYATGTICSQSSCNFSSGVGKIWLDYVQCNGYENGLNECWHYGWGNLRSCTHAEDIGVRCGYQN